MSKQTAYEVDQRRMSLLKHYGHTSCWTCGRPLEVGQEVISKWRRFGGAKVRHRECAVRVHVMVEEEPRWN